jgi:hypothetical protein
LIGLAHKPPPADNGFWFCQVVEGESLRGTVIRIDDSNYLRRFVRIFNGPMIDSDAHWVLENAGEEGELAAVVSNAPKKGRQSWLSR